MVARRWQFAVVAILLVLAIPATAQGPEQAGAAPGRNVQDMEFGGFPGLSTCSPGTVLNGDPGRGASIILAKISAGCVIPRHWHTPSENLMMVSGLGQVEMKGAPSLTLSAGGFALMPARHVHSFRGQQDCLLYIYSDAAFDIHYVDAHDNELTPAAALEPYKETAVTAAQ